MAMDQAVSPTNSPKLWNLTPLGLAPSPVVSPKHHGKLHFDFENTYLALMVLDKANYI